MKTSRNQQLVTENASSLPYVIVRSAVGAPNIWTVVSAPGSISGSSQNAGVVQFRIDAPGKYRLYIKEPLEVFEQNSVFVIQQHALANGADSGREVQPLLELDVVENADCSLSVQVVHPNGLGRARGNASDQVPADGAQHRFTAAHQSRALDSALDLGNYMVTFQLWADASRTYGIRHPRIVNSRFRNELEAIYGETLTVGTAAGVEAHNRILATETIEVEFNHQSTTGGRARFSFREQNGQQNNRMTSDETLRRTHPATMEFLFQMMADLDIHYARSTGAWRPHHGSTLHRHAAALDITHLRTYVNDANGQRHLVEIHLHVTQSTASNPRSTTQQETAQRTRMREFSNRVHTYIAVARQERTLGWLGGPWPLTYAQLGLLGPFRGNPTTRAPNDLAIKTDSGHTHHIHITMGTDRS